MKPLTTILSFNIRYDSSRDEPYSWSRRRHHTFQLLRFHSPEVLFLQEVLPGQMSDIREYLPEYDWVYAPRREGDEACPIGFKVDRFVSPESGVYWLSETPEVESVGWDAELPRVATWAKLHRVDTDSRFFAVCIHLDHRGGEARRKSAELIAGRTVAKARDQALPVVIGGDFNCTLDDEPFGPLRSVGMLDARAAAEVSPLGPAETCPGSGFRVTTDIGRRIDYILVSPNLNVGRFATLTDNMYGVRPSDHLPIWCEVEL